MAGKSTIRVLVIDDDAVIRKCFCNILERHGYQVITAIDGQSGIDAAVNFTPDIIFLDVVMPNMDGFQALQQLRRIPKTRKIPIIIVTARADAATLIKALKMGANDFIAKPFVKSDVSRKMNFVLMNQHQQKAFTEATLVHHPTPFRNGRTYRRMRSNFILNFENIYLSMIRLITERKKEELKKNAAQLLETAKFYDFRGVKEKVLQMLLAINLDDWNRTIELLENIYMIFMELQKTLPPSA